ncbi:dihydrofolate reductase family protein [Brevibacterium atlanticum]|uniref:dihydrofolate reductase family protein n=1 Tax=Brevibacterium atlanticum TaxID=2697563 RepID=UPI00141E5FC2|nr:dihydrofolate reductase family protein [Brevibacterium atlanticum]
MSRTVIAALFQSLDGIASDPFTFQFDSFDQEMGEWMTTAIDGVDDCLLGRVTYQEWENYWPNHTEGDDAPFADFINATPKHVASSTLTPKDLRWENSSLIDGDLVEFVRDLKAADGGKIAVEGSMSVVRQLIEEGLVDELTLAIHPVMAGSGRSLFAGGATTRLDLREVQRTSKGNLLATYGPRLT